MKWLRLLLRVLLAVAGLLALAVLIALGPLRERTSELLRRQVEGLLAAALDTPVAIAGLRLAFLPPRLDADAVVLGSDGALARAAHVRVRLLPRTSLRQMRPVADATIDDVFVAVPGWIELLDKHRPASPTATVIPPFRLRHVRINGARVRLAEHDPPFDLTAAAVNGALQADVRGRLHFAAELEQVVLIRRGAALPLARARLRGRETADGWRLTAVEAEGDGVQLASGDPAADRLPIRGHVELQRLAFASDLFERLRGDAELDVALVGRLEDPAVAGSVRVPDFTVDGEPLGTVSATADWNVRRLRVETARLEEGGGTAEASGELQMETPFRFDATLGWASVDLPRLLRLPPQTVKPSTAEGQAALTGTLEPLVVSADGSGRFIAAQGGDPLDWRGQGSYRDGGGAGEIEAGQAGTNALRASLGVGPGGALSGSLAATVGNPTALGAFVPLESVPNVSGSLSVAAQMSGTTRNPRLSGELTGREVVLLGVATEKLDGRFELDRAAFRTPGITATFWRGSIAFAGAIALDAAGQNDWQLQVVDVPGDAVVGLVYGLTGSVPPIGRGTLAAQATGRGPWSRVQVAGSATMESFWLSREWIQRASLRVDATWPVWQLTAELRNTSGQTIALRGRGRGIDDVAIDAHSAAWQMTGLERDALTEMGGTLTLDASLAGPLAALSGRAALGASGLVVQGRRIGNVDLAVVATRGRWEATTALLDGAVRLRARLAPDGGWPVNVDGEWSDADLARLLAPDAEIRASSSGTLRVTLLLVDPERFDATVNLQRLQVVSGPYELASVRPALIECRRGACRLDELALRGANTQLRASGSLGPGGAFELRVSGDGDLRLLELAGEPVESARGRFTVDAAGRRVGGRWDVSGQLRVDQAALDVGAPVAVTRATGRLTLAGSAIRVDELAGRIGTGSFAVGGRIDLGRGPELTWTLTDVGADFLPSLEAELSGRGGLEGTWEHMRLYGDIEVARMLYDRDVELADFLPRLNRALAEAPRPPSARRVDLDLHIAAPGQLYVENNIARIEARADLRITGSAERPQLDGRIEVLDGTVTFRDRTFELQGGTVDFRPDLGLTAALNITAESTIDTPDATYTVDVRVTGTTRDPRVTMTSDDPSLSTTDVATLIAVGRTTAQLREGGGGGFSIYDALAAVPGQLSGQFEQTTKQILPVDRISFESTYSRTTGTFEPQLKLGKDLTDALSVALGQTFGVESRSSVEAAYRLTPRVSGLFTWESQTSTQEGAFGLGVKVRYEFWRVTPYTLLQGWR
jgi:autotransporter translocation and assembly factor TamB